jgi:hypothetical protein
VPAFPTTPHAYPPEFLDWIAGLARFRRLSAELRGGWWTIKFDSQVHMAGHTPGMTHFSTFTLPPAAVAGSVDWRRLVAAHIRRVRWACRRRTDPRSVLGKIAPQLPP